MKLKKHTVFSQSGGASLILVKVRERRDDGFTRVLQQISDSNMAKTALLLLVLGCWCARRSHTESEEEMSTLAAFAAAHDICHIDIYVLGSLRPLGRPAASSATVDKALRRRGFFTQVYTSLVAINGEDTDTNRTLTPSQVGRCQNNIQGCGTRNHCTVVRSPVLTSFYVQEAWYFVKFFGKRVFAHRSLVQSHHVSIQSFACKKFSLEWNTSEFASKLFLWKWPQVQNTST